MSDYDRNEQLEFQFSQPPDFNQLMANRLAAAPKPTEAKPTGFDPYKVMVDKKASDEGKPIDTSNTIKWPEKDVKALEDFCKKYNILGFDFGNMSPIAAIAMLKNMLGIVDGPLESRVPQGYEKLGTKPIYNPNYPYQSAMNQKILLNG